MKTKKALFNDNVWFCFYLLYYTTMPTYRFLNDGGRVAIVDIDKQRGKLKMEELASQGMAADRTG